MAIDIMDMVKGAVTKSIMGKIGGLLGTDESKTSSIFGTAAGAILGGLMKKASSTQGAQEVFESVQKQDAGILDKLGDLLGGGDATADFEKSGEGVLGAIFGGSQAGIISTIAKTLGVDGAMIGKLLKMAAPIVLAVIGRHLKSKALDAVGLGSLLGEQKNYLASSMPAALSGSLGFGDMLGNVTDAVSGVAGQVGAVGNSVADGIKETAKSGGGILKYLLALFVIAAIAWPTYVYVVIPAMRGTTDFSVITPKDGLPDLRRIQVAPGN